MSVLLHFQSGFLLFLFLFWLLWLGLPKLCWIKVVRVGILAPELKEYFSFSTLSMMLIVGLLYMALVCYVPSILTLLRVFFFNHRWILYFVKRFSASIEMILWFLFFSLVMWWITWTDLQIWNHLCIPGINPTYDVWSF